MKAPVPLKVIDLSPTITEDLPVRVWGHRPLSDFGFSDATEFRVIQTQDPLYVSNAYWTLFNHAGPHVDAPNHLDATAHGIDRTPLTSLVGPLRIADFREWPSNQAIGAQEFQRLELEPGDIVVVFTGYKPPTNPTDIPSFKTISREAAEYLAGIPVRAFATDALSADSFEEIYRLMAEGKKGYETIAPVHHAFLPRGIPVIEQLVNLEELSSEDNAVFVGLPLKVRNGDGSPIRAAAFVY